jgi:hypothetical protein
MTRPACTEASLGSSSEQCNGVQHGAPFFVFTMAVAHEFGADIRRRACPSLLRGRHVCCGADAATNRHYQILIYKTVESARAR